MKISKRADRLPASPIRKLIPYADAAKERGVRVYHLNIGQPDIRTPDTFLNAIRNYKVDVLEYGPSNGLASYRKGLVEYYKRWNIGVEPGQIFITTGGSESILFALLAVTDDGDNVLVMEPFYTNYHGFASMIGVNVIGVPTRPEDGFAIPPIEEFEKRCNSRTRAILICNPNNPTGAVYPRSDLERLEKFAVKRGLFILSDEVYREFTYDGLRYCSIMHLEKMGDSAIVVDSVSKRYSACGARIGCIVTRNQSVLSSIMRMGQARLCPPTLEQVGALAAIDTPARYMEEVIAEYQHRRDVLYEGLNRIDGVFCEKPCGAFYMMVTLPVKDGDDFARFMLEEFEDNKETVMVAPGAGFYATEGSGLNQVRMAYVLKSEDLIRSVELLKIGLQAYRQKSQTS